MRVVVLMALGAVACAADGAGDLASATRAARDQAERAAAATRARIADEQAALIAALQQAITAGNAARERLATADREAREAADELARLLAEQDREFALIRQIADRAMVAARLGVGVVEAYAGKPPLERADAAIAGVERRVQALPARLALSLADEAVVGRRGGIATVPVLRLGEARAVALGADGAHRGLMERAGDGGSWLVVGPSLPSSAQPDGGRVALIPLDASGSAAHRADDVRRSFAQWLAAGRFFIWPIVAVLVIGVGLAIERVIALMRRRVDARRLVAVAERLAADDAAGAAALVGAGATPLDRVLASGLKSQGRPREIREAVVEQALLSETAQLSRGLPAIAVLAGVAPLLGLLGTVTGMIDMFSVIAAQGSGNARSLSGGISEALITTQAGMLVAIPLLLVHAWLARLAERRSQLLEEAACGVLGLSEHGDAVRPVPAP